MGFEYLGHTADEKIRATGKTLEEALSNAVLGVANMVVPIEKIEPREKREIEARGVDLESLLYDLVDNTIFLVDVEGFVPCRVERLEVGKEGREMVARGVLVGDLLSRGYERGVVPKAATYNDMGIREKNGEWELVFVVDI